MADNLFHTRLKISAAKFWHQAGQKAKLQPRPGELEKKNFWKIDNCQPTLFIIF
jgi:hypothetical protein